MADIVEVAVGLDDWVGRISDGAFAMLEMPETGSDLEEGQRPRAGFFGFVHPSFSTSPFKVAPFIGSPLLETVEVDEAEDADPVEEAEEEEFDRCGTLRGINICE